MGMTIISHSMAIRELDMQRAYQTTWHRDGAAQTGKLYGSAKDVWDNIQDLVKNPCLDYRPGLSQ